MDTQFGLEGALNIFLQCKLCGFPYDFSLTFIAWGCRLKPSRHFQFCSIIWLKIQMSVARYYTITQLIARRKYSEVLRDQKVALKQ